MIAGFKLNEWRTIHTSSGVRIESKTADCNLDNSFKQRWFLLKFSNSTTSKLKVEWDLELKDESGKCVTCSESATEYHYAIELNPMEIKQGECKINCAKELRIISKLLDVKTSMSYPDFELKNIKVSAIK